MSLINLESPAGQAFSAYCEGDLVVSDLSAHHRDEFASVARMWLNTPAIANPSAPEDRPLPSFLRDFIAELEGQPIVMTGQACIYPQRPPIVVVYETEYSWVGDEGDMYADGDHENAYRKVIACVPDQWDREEGKSCVGLAVEVMNDQPAYLEPDCSSGAPSWFCGSDEENDRAYRTGGWTEYSVHFYGFSALQRVLIGKAYNAR